MSVGGALGAGLILLVVASEKLSAFLWHDGGHDAARHYCPTCDLRYTRAELADRRRRLCPHGHPTGANQGFPWTVVLVSALVTFIVTSIALTASGLV